MTQTNPYFADYYNNTGSDQLLLDSLIDEDIKMKGRDIIYIPRELVAFDRLYGEDKLSAFSTYYTIAMYIENFNSFEGQREVVTSFGFEVRDEIRLVVNKNNFTSTVTTNDPTLVRPREGDLVYFPLDSSLFEISYVENEEVFYELSKVFTYQLFCKRFELGSETFNTGITAIDNIPTQFGSNAQLQLSGGAGVFDIGEIVYQGTAIETATFMAEVINFNSTANTLLVTKTRGEVDVTQTITGFTSGAIWLMTTDVAGNQSQTTEETNAANLNFIIDTEAEAKNVIIRTPKNPLAW